MEPGADTGAGRRIGELERLGPERDDIMVLGVEADGFEQLSRTQRLLAYHLYRAAVAGNAIAFHQAHRDAYDIKSLLEAIHLHSGGMDPALCDAVHDYLKYVWIHHGQYDHLTHTKYTPHALTPAGLRLAAEYAAARGARLPLRSGETPAALLARLERSIFDADFEPLQTNQSEGVDIVATSAVNYWDPGVTLADIEALAPEWRHKLNVRYARDSAGRLTPQTCRIGGLYGAELERVSAFLAMALPCVETDEQRRSIELLLDYYRDGEEATFREHCVHWLRSNSAVDYVNGFIEVYLDPRGIIGQFEANVSYKAAGGLIDRIAAEARYFEARMPWPDRYKRTDVRRPVANVVNVLVETGDAGPVSPAAYNLPNYNDIRRDHGSKNVILHNIENTWSRELEEQTVDAFFLPEYRDNALAYWHTVVRPIQVYLHEIIGHGSGRPDDALAGDPRTRIGRTYSALEECRADLVALYHMADEKLVELGAFGAAERDAVVETSFVMYLQGWLSRIDRIPGLDVREAHARGHHAILVYLVEGGGRGEDFGVEITEVDGDYYVRLTDAARVRAGVAELLSKIQVIKSTGDAAGAEALFDRFGTRLDADWKANVVARKAVLHLPRGKAFVFPRLKPVVEGGRVVDAALHHDEDLTAQQLRFSRLETSVDPTED